MRPASRTRAGDTCRLPDAAQRAGVARFVHCSTVGVHGHVKGLTANEDAPLATGDIYQNTKLEGEQLARAAGREGGMQVDRATLRSTNSWRSSRTN